LLFHALASPNVINGVDGKELDAFPTLAEIETIENYVYGVQAPTIQQLMAQSQGQPISIVVFATEYRPASETVHQRHADLCFSRTGVCRVGNAEALYDDHRRGFLPFDKNNDFGFRVLSAKYSAYVAIQMRGGDGSLFGPMRFISVPPEGSDFGPDTTRKFWVPLHKLFDGEECIKGLNLKVSLLAHHVNEKIKRIHMQLQGSEFSPGIPGYPKVDDATLNKSPYKFTAGIAELSTNPDFGQGLLVPIVHPRLIETAEFEGQPLNFRVPRREGNINIIGNNFDSTLTISSDGLDRHAPEYVHVRQMVLGDGHTVTNLNSDRDLVNKVAEGEYIARHFIDFTGDGWIEASCPALNDTVLPPVKPAYSLVTSPDFYPNVDQGELMDWYIQSVPKQLRDLTWLEPFKLATLSDERLPANLELNEPSNLKFPFSKNDDSVTAIVSLPIRDRIQRPFESKTPATMRHSYLPDAASGLYQPGWDVSRDTTRGVSHLASYGLGSPFPEDSKLCAALSSYWPGVAPDAGRSFWPTPPTISPMTDEEIGQIGNFPWDGVKGPKILNIGGKSFIEYIDFDYVDYVDNMLGNKFTLKLTGQVDISKYKSRILALARAYTAANIIKPQRGDVNVIKRSWPVLSFKEIPATNPELLEAQTKSGGTILNEPVYRIEICSVSNPQKPTDQFSKFLVEIRKRMIFFVGSGMIVLLSNQDGNWRNPPVQTP
jgi:hypothetical protein